MRAGLARLAASGEGVTSWTEVSVGGVLDQRGSLLETHRLASNERMRPPLGALLFLAVFIILSEMVLRI